MSEKKDNIEESKDLIKEENSPQIPLEEKDMENTNEIKESSNKKEDKKIEENKIAEEDKKEDNKFIQNKRKMNNQ